MSHIEESELAQAIDGTLPIARSIVVKSHLMACKECREKLEELKKTKAEFKKLLPYYKKLNQAESESDEATAEVMTRLSTRISAKEHDAEN